MACSNCGPNGCFTKAVTVTLFKKTWSASEMAAARRRQQVEGQNVFVRESVPASKVARPGDSESGGVTGNTGNGDGQPGPK